MPVAEHRRFFVDRASKPEIPPRAEMRPRSDSAGTFRERKIFSEKIFRDARTVRVFLRAIADISPLH
jgi:hypothetical protein